MKIRNIALAGVMGVAGMGLIGVGAHAVFTQNTVSAQQINAGTMNVTLSSPNASGNGTASIQLPNVGPTGSSFTTGDEVVTITNQSSFPVNEITATPGDIHGGDGASIAFAAEAYLCEVSSGQVIYNGLLSAAPAQTINGTLAPAATDTYTVNVYAGNSETTACGAVVTPGSSAVSGVNPAALSLDNSAQGGTIDPTMTVSYTG